ncbi:hypothetical protein HK097_000888 [Rhizophlyctis rosea]|uniref:Uncharacterized protein n=1 Tax=Rhizophlyctis rosea TaxID=64517 RepID=A0AAD5WZ78_9FUNG|nr:hypothetical protein HK097_000888 [Rhizophlyctis rosea]
MLSSKVLVPLLVLALEPLEAYSIPSPNFRRHEILAKHRYNFRNIYLTPDTSSTSRLDPVTGYKLWAEYLLDLNEKLADLLPGTYADYSSGTGNKQPPDGYTDALKEVTDPQLDPWYGYDPGNITAIKHVVGELNGRMKNVNFDEEDVTLTVRPPDLFMCLYLLLMFTSFGNHMLTPSYFEYEAMITDNGCKAVKVATNYSKFTFQMLTPWRKQSRRRLWGCLSIHRITLLECKLPGFGII